MFALCRFSYPFLDGKQNEIIPPHLSVTDAMTGSEQLLVLCCERCYMITELRKHLHTLHALHITGCPLVTNDEEMRVLGYLTRMELQHALARPEWIQLRRSESPPSLSISIGNATDRLHRDRTRSEQDDRKDNARMSSTINTKPHTANQSMTRNTHQLNQQQQLLHSSSDLVQSSEDDIERQHLLLTLHSHKIRSGSNAASAPASTVNSARTASTSVAAVPTVNANTQANHSATHDPRRSVASTSMSVSNHAHPLPSANPDSSSTVDQVRDALSSGSSLCYFLPPSLREQHAIARSHEGYISLSSCLMSAHRIEPLLVNSSMSLQRTHDLFTKLGLRFVLVLHRGRLTGIVTKKDLLALLKQYTNH